MLLDIFAIMPTFILWARWDAQKRFNSHGSHHGSPIDAHAQTYQCQAEQKNFVRYLAWLIQMLPCVFFL